METIKHIKLLLVALLVGMTATSCMDDDWDAPSSDTNPYGNASITETNLVSIKELKERYKNEINTSYAYKQVTEPLQIKGYVTGNDVEGNIYNEISIQDETGAIYIAIAQGGINGYLPVGTEIVVELNGLYVGNYGKQAEIGTPYTNASGNTYVSRMNRMTWQEHFRITGKTKEMEPELFADGDEKTTWDISDDSGKLGIIKNVSIKGATSKMVWSAPDGGQSTSLYLNEQPSTVLIYTSPYCDFAGKTVPQGKCNITGIFKRFNNSWEIIIRSIDDVEEIK